MRAAAIEQRRRFVEPSLPPPQLPEAGKAVAGHSRAAERELVAGVRQLTLGFFPGAAPHAHRRVLRPAHGEERLQSPLPAVFLDAVAPLDRALVVAEAIAGANQIATSERDQQAIAQLAGERRRADFVELAQPLRDPAHRHEREPVQRAADHLVVDRADRPADANGFGRQRFGFFRIAVVQEGEDRGASGQKSVFGGVRLPFQQAARALEPALGDAFFAPERGTVPCDPDGDPGGRQLIAAAAVRAIRALAGIEHDGRQIEPPRRQAEAFERFRRFLGLHRPFEGLERLLPGSRLEGHTTGGQIVGRLREGHWQRLYRCG